MDTQEKNANGDDRSARLESTALYNLVLLCIGVTCVLISECMLLIAVPLRALELGASPAFVGVVMSVPYLLPLAFAIPIGEMVTRVGAKKILILGSAGMVIGPCLSLLWPNDIGLIGTQVTIGLAQIVTVIASQSAVTSLGSGRRLERYFGWYSTCLSAGQLIGPLLAGYMIDRLAMTWVFGTIAAIPAIGLLTALLMMNSTNTEPLAKQRGSTQQAYREQVTILRSNVAVQIAIVTTIATLFAIGAHSAFLPIYLEQHAFSATLIGALISLRAFFSMLVRPFMAQIIQAIRGRSNTLILSVAGIAIGIMWTGTTDSVWLLAFFAFLAGIGSGITQPLSIIIVAEHVQIAQRASAFGMRLMGNRGAQILAPLALGILAETVGFSWAFFIAGTAMLSTLLLVIRLKPAFDQAEQALHQRT